MKENMSPNHKKPGYMVPDNYFEDFESRILHAVTKKSASIDRHYSAQSGFLVPGDYFDNLEQNILQKVDQSKGVGQDNGRVVSLYKKKKLYYAAAIAAVFIGILTTTLFNPVAEELSVNNLELTAIEEYINEGYIDFTFNEISAFMAEGDYSFDHFNTTGLSDEEVFDYLSENIEDPNELFE